MDRRAFIKLTAVSGASAGLASCGNPEHQLIRFIPEDELVPGVAEWKPSVCPLCASGCGLLVRIMEADVEVEREGLVGVVRQGVAKKLEGNPDHPISRGGLCARGQASIQVTYHPDRLTGPMRRVGPRGEGRFEALSWEAALGEVVARLDALSASGARGELGCLTDGRRSRRHELLAEFCRAFGAPPPVAHELFSDAVVRRANAISFGHAQLPTVDLARTNYVLNFGTDLLATWNAPVAHAAAYAAMRQGRPGIRGRLVQVEARMSQTGTSADEWLPAAPGTEGMLALGLAHVIMRDRLRAGDAAGSAGQRIAGWGVGLPDYTPAAVERATGVAAARIERLARDFALTPPAVAIIGGAPLAHSNGLAGALAVNALNALVGAVESPGGLFFASPASPRAIDARSSTPTLQDWASGLRSGSRRVGVLVLDGVNPVFSSPSAWQVREALDKVPFIVSVGRFIDETSAHADLLLPDHSALESWVDALPESGALSTVTSFAPPAMRPIHRTRATPDVLLDIGRGLQQPLGMPWQTFEEFLRARFEAGGSRPPEAWAEATRRGGSWDVSPPSASRPSMSSPESREPARPAAADRVDVVETVRMPEFSGDIEGYPFHFLPYPSVAFHDGSVAHLPWLQEMPDPMTSALWSSWVEINPTTAEKLGVRQGDVVEVASPHGVLRSGAIISPGIAPNLVAMPVGQGHTMFTRYATGRGENPVAILSPLVEPDTGTLAWAATRVRLTRIGGPDGRLILFAGESREHPSEGGTR